MTTKNTVSQSVSKPVQLKVGQVVKVYQKIKEGAKERIQVFQGLIIDLHGKSGMSHTFTVRKVVDGIGVEKIFPLLSPFIDKIEVVKEAKVRRSNLSYIRTRTGKSARMKGERMLNEILGINVVEEKKEEEPVVEEVVVEEKPVVEEEKKEEVVVEEPAVEEEKKEEVVAS